MVKSREMSRSVWTTDGKYLVMAHAKFRTVRGLTGQRIAKAVVHVFAGNPVVSGVDAIFSGFSDLHSYDLLDELQNAERIGRDFVAALR
jgi:hypothetical protein